RDALRAHRAVANERASAGPQWCSPRRRFLASASAAGAMLLISDTPTLADEGPPETTTVRLAKITGICVAPQYAAEELLRAEGFRDIRYVETISGPPMSEKLVSGEIDCTMNFVGPLLTPIDADEPVTIIAGIHPGCFELFANESIHRISDLKG